MAGFGHILQVVKTTQQFLEFYRVQIGVQWLKAINLVIWSEN